MANEKGIQPEEIWGEGAEIVALVIYKEHPEQRIRDGNRQYIFQGLKEK